MAVTGFFGLAIGGLVKDIGMPAQVRLHRHAMVCPIA